MEEEPAECPYCGESFDSEHEKGVHLSEQHVSNDSIPRKKRNAEKKNDITKGWNGK